jgi:hypothetical protein
MIRLGAGGTGRDGPGLSGGSHGRESACDLTADSANQEPPYDEAILLAKLLVFNPAGIVRRALGAYSGCGGGR